MINNIEEAFEKTRIAGSIAAGALDEVSNIIKPGLMTSEIDSLCYDYINDNIEERLLTSRFDSIKSESHFMTRVWSANKPL